jgi:hypothetical protein
MNRQTAHNTTEPAEKPDARGDDCRDTELDGSIGQAEAPMRGIFRVVSGSEPHFRTSEGTPKMLKAMALCLSWGSRIRT